MASQTLSKNARSVNALTLAGASFGYIFAALVSTLTLTACAPTSSNTSITAKSANAGIVGGDDAKGDEDFAKSTVMLVDTKIGALCTASIIADDLLITAAHCVVSDAKDLVVLFGTDLTSTNLIKRPVIATESSPLWASRQNEELNTGDMALVGFSGGIPQGYKVAKMLGDISKLTDGEEVLLAGYGESDGDAGTGAGLLRSVKVKISKVALSESEILFMQTDGKGACHGDSGGPAYATVNGAQVLIGVTSRGVDKCHSASIYTNIPYYSQWILRAAKSLDSQVKKPTAAPSAPVVDAPAIPVAQNAPAEPAAPAAQPAPSPTPAPLATAAL